jgi:hypothetical protein
MEDAAKAKKASWFSSSLESLCEICDGQSLLIIGEVPDILPM